ncbi:MAG: hypothetical protein QF793_00485 [Candidatus Peribacteraceae bacterium]|jgi:hypothetical protein|nr:hypothetical protein [Candidatus Peribacteraceae bacterium]|tara:strand:+ start:21869 stop:22321 length:453 start_codon:yes stop_codon:yes gene_type:complete
MHRQRPTPEGLRQIVEEKHLNDTHGARRYFMFLSTGPAKVRGFVRELGLSVEQPYLDNPQGVDTWLKTMDALFKNIPTNKGAVETIGWITRRFIARGLTEAVLKESMVHAEDIRREVAAIVGREGSSKKKAPTRGSGMSGGPGFTYQPNP